MRALLLREFGPVEDLAVDTLEPKELGADEVRIEIHATALNFVDTLVITGKYQFLPVRPFVPGKLPVGTVVEVGASVSRFRVGDRVLTLLEHGGYAEQAIAPQSACFKLPDRLAHADAAAMALAFDTAWFALRDRGRASTGETVLVLGGLGAVGLAAVQLAKAYGMYVIAGINGLDRKAEALAAGADAVVDLSISNLRDGLREQVHQLTSGAGADVILDPLGGDVFDAALRALAWRGRLVVIGFAAGRIPTVKVNYLLLKNIEVSGVQVSDYRKKAPEEMARCIDEIFRLFEAGQIRPPLSTHVSLTDTPATLSRIQRREASGRFVMTRAASTR